MSTVGTPARIETLGNNYTPENASNRIVKLEVVAEINSTSSALEVVTDFATDANQLTQADHNLSNDDVVRFESTGTLPSPLAVDTDYHVVNSGSGVFEVSATQGGAPIEFTDDGTGTHSYYVYVTDVSLGAQSATEAEYHRRQAWVAGTYYIKEADIPAGASAVDVTFSGGNGSIFPFILCTTLSGRDQTNPVSATHGEEYSGSNPYAGTLPSASAGDDVGVSIVGAVPSRAITGISGDMSLIDEASGGNYVKGWGGADNVAAGDVNFSVTFSSTNSGAVSMTAFATISGLSATEGDTDVPVGQDPGFTGNVNGINLKTSSDTYSVALDIGASSTNSAPTFDMPDLVNVVYETAWCPYETATHGQLQIEVTSDDGGDTPLEVDIARSLPSGYAVRELASVSTAKGSFFHGVASPETIPPDTSQIIYPTANDTSIAADGTVTTNQNGGFMTCWVWRSDTGMIEMQKVYLPGQLALTNFPSTMDPSTEYEIDVENGTSVASEFYIVDEGTEYECTVESATDIDSITITTPASLPTDTPTTNMKAVFPAP